MAALLKPSPRQVGEAQFRRLLLADSAFIDVRAEIEYARGSIPGAVNLPILNTQEREQVGRCYKQEGPEAAIALGHRLVTGAVREARIEGWLDVARSHPGSHVFCWRGGMRSGLAAAWLAEAGQDVPVVHGGYKALRRFLMQTTCVAVEQRPLLIVGGRTGAGKTELLRDLEAGVDLEALASHRGSSFGRLIEAPPTQIDFEHRLALALLRLDAVQPTGPLLLEDESRRIGAVSLPLELYRAMETAPMVLLEVTLEERIGRILQDYVIDLSAAYQAVDPRAGYERYCAHLLDGLARIRKKLGGERYAALRRVMEVALAQQRKGSLVAHEAWISGLLLAYYDPMYDYQLAKASERLIYRGNRDAVLAFCQAFSGRASGT